MKDSRIWTVWEKTLSGWRITFSFGKPQHFTCSSSLYSKLPSTPGRKGEYLKSQNGINTLLAHCNVQNFFCRKCRISTLSVLLLMLGWSDEFMVHCQWGCNWRTLALKQSLRILEYTGHSPPLDHRPRVKQNTEACEWSVLAISGQKMIILHYNTHPIQRIIMKLLEQFCGEHHARPPYNAHVTHSDSLLFEHLRMHFKGKYFWCDD